MSKMVKAYNLSLDVIKEINKRALDDDRKDSPWLDRYLRKQLKLDVKPKAKKKEVIANDSVAGVVPCSDGQYEVMQSSMDLWANAYPNVNIVDQLNKLVAWLDSNPKKTKSGCKRFINSWLNRAQNSVKSANQGASMLEQSANQDWHKQDTGF